MFTYLLQVSPGLLIAAAASSVLSGICGVLLLSLINRLLNESERLPFILPFAMLAVGAMLCRMFANVSFQHLGESTNARLRHFIADKVTSADYQTLEAVGSAPIQSALAEHVSKVAEFFASMPSLLTNAIIVCGCLTYMALLSWPLFFVALLMIAIGSLGYHLAHMFAIKHLAIAAKEQDRLYGYFRALTEGAKELRINRQKREIFSQDVLGHSIESVRRSRAFGMSMFVAVGSWGSFLAYAFVGLVLFALAGNNQKVATGYALLCIYMVAPLEVLLVNIPRINLARTAMARIQTLIDELSSRERDDASLSLPSFERIELRHVLHSYRREDSDKSFSLGPINLEFPRGQLTFLVGGNGSGKTTLAKLLVGLYVPEQGEVLLNGRPIDDSLRDRYRQLFSIIFSDFHLFDSLLEPERPELDADGTRLLKKLRLDHIVGVRGGAFTRLALSQGQRRRLALVQACLEDRPFLIFDEWAADQDPAFKEIFYHELLPELRTQGRAVVVISHDDRYFQIADRIIWMEDGKVTSVTTNQSDPPAPHEQGLRVLSIEAQPQNTH
jgi:putative pyoverdin transport system ATP-binding/permease protein